MACGASDRRIQTTFALHLLAMGCGDLERAPDKNVGEYETMHATAINRRMEKGRHHQTCRIGCMACNGPGSGYAETWSALLCEMAGMIVDGRVEG